MAGLFFITTLNAVLMYYVIGRVLERRNTAAAMRRVGRMPEEQEPSRSVRPKVIDGVKEARGLITGRLLAIPQFRDRARNMLEVAALKWTPVDLLRRSIGLFLTGFLIATVVMGNAMPAAALAVGLLFGAAPLWYVQRKGRARVRAVEEQLPDCLEFISRSMRAGHAFSVALEMACKEFSDPVAGELRRAFEQQNLGQPLEIVLRRLVLRVPSIDMGFFVSAVLLQKRTGGNLAELLDKLAQLMRERFKLRARIRAVSAQGLMSGRILSSIPAAVAAIMFVVNPSYASFFVKDPVGHELCAAALTLQFLGYAIIRKLVTFEI
ncbi:MAG TPA: type II secretion system F family protein [Candidatus Limnocylindrales bacterium]|nr:type II secretion system F family protein [Candidatus Limnocylindrales bacterium]